MTDLTEPRHIDTASGVLEGEAAQMRVSRTGFSGPARLPAVRVPPSPATDDAPTYYGLPVVKYPPWNALVPSYFFAGGMSGGAAALGAALQVLGHPTQRRLVRRCRWLAFVGISTGAVFLVVDLGRPAKFFHMLRVVRPTSALNMGAWIIGLGGISSGLSVVARGRARALGELAGLVAGANGLLLATYTSAVLSTTAIPAWNRAPRSLALLFGSSSVSSAAGLLACIDGDPVLLRLLQPATAVELAANGLMSLELGPGILSEPLRQGRSGRLWQASQALAIGALVASLGSGRRARRISGLLATAAGLAVRFAVMRIGRASAQDPRATFESGSR